MRLSFLALSLFAFVLTGTGCAPVSPTTMNEEAPVPAPTKSEAKLDRYILSTELIALMDDGSKQTVVTATTDSIDGGQRFLLSPNNNQTIFANWENAHYIIYLTDLPDGAAVTKIAEQSIPEGHGWLDTNSIMWIDEHRIVYRELGTACGESGEPTLINPGTNCEGSIVLSWQVDTENGAKTLINTSQQMEDGSLKDLTEISE